MAKNAHLILDDRTTIEIRLRERASFTEIGNELGKDPSTISKEIKKHSQIVRSSSYNPCAKRSTCHHRKDICKPCKVSYATTCKSCSSAACYEHCPDFVELVCHKLDKPPYVCNGCDTRHSCKLNRRLYKAKDAQKAYEASNMLFPDYLK